MTDEDRLREIVRQEPRLLEILAAARRAQLPEWAVGGGILRSLVWDVLHGYAERTQVPDVDVPFFDAAGMEDETACRKLARELPGVPWQPVNQALLQRWRTDITEPVDSVSAGIATWSETATAVAVVLLDDGGLEVIAPYGLDDLFGCVFRRVRAHATEAVFAERAESKRIAERWPRVRIEA